MSNSILLPKVALPGTPILFHFLPLIILTARTSGVSRRYTIERHLAKTSRKRIKSISLYSLLKSVMTAVKTAQGLQDDFKCAKIRLNIQTHKRLLPVHNAVTCSPTLCLVTHLKAHMSHHRARNTPQATCLVEKRFKWARNDSKMLFSASKKKKTSFHRIKWFFFLTLEYEVTKRCMFNCRFLNNFRLNHFYSQFLFNSFHLWSFSKVLKNK